VTYAWAEAYLLELELFGMRLGLERMQRLSAALGHPERSFASIHVVGTNGKSSTVHMIAALLRRHGLRVGSYTSPHLRSFAERIEVDGRAVGDEDFAAAVERTARAVAAVDGAAEDIDDRVTQFEALTAAAFSELARREVEVAVIEAGLGGRLDATNVISSRVSALTSVGLEHTRWLGATVVEIAVEKLAVVEEASTLVTGVLPAEVEELADRSAAACHARRVRASAWGGPALRARGAFQRSNFGVAVAAAEAFAGPLAPEALREVAGHVEVPGRLEEVGREPLVMLDGAHNPPGALALSDALPEVLGGRALTLVLGMLDDKDVPAMLAALLPGAERVLFTRPAHRRAVAPAALEAQGRASGATEIETVDDPRDALERARVLAGPQGAVLVTGSLHLVGELKRGRRGLNGVDRVRAPAVGRRP